MENYMYGDISASGTSATPAYEPTDCQREIAVRLALDCSGFEEGDTTVLLARAKAIADFLAGKK